MHGKRTTNGAVINRLGYWGVAVLRLVIFQWFYALDRSVRGRFSGVQERMM